MERTGDQLKNKFNKLVCKDAPFGDPNIPFSVQETKAIRIHMIEKSEGVTGFKDEGFAVEDKEEDGADSAAEGDGVCKDDAAICQCN